MRNHSSKLLIFVLLGATGVISGVGYAGEIDDVHDAMNLCRFADPVSNPFAREGSVDDPTDAEDRAEAEPRERSADPRSAANSSPPIASSTRRVYSSRSRHGGVVAEVEVRRGLTNGDPSSAVQVVNAVGGDGPDFIPPTPGQESSALLVSREVSRYADARRAAVIDTYETLVDSSQFRVGTYDAASETLTVTLREPIAIDGGLATLRFADPRSLYFALSERGAEYVESQWRAGTMELWLRYEVIARDNLLDAYCGQNEMGGPEIRGALLDATLYEPMHRQRLATASTDRAQRERCERETGEVRTADPTGKLVEVHTLESLGSDTMTEAEAILLANFAEIMLGECFFNARNANAALDGAVVINFRLETDGGLSEPTFAIDALRNEGFRRCALDAFQESAIPRMAGAVPLDTRMTLIFGPRR